MPVLNPVAGSLQILSMPGRRRTPTVTSWLAGYQTDILAARIPARYISQPDVSQIYWPAGYQPDILASRITDTYIGQPDTRQIYWPAGYQTDIKYFPAGYRTGTGKIY